MKDMLLVEISNSTEDYNMKNADPTTQRYPW